MKRISLYVAVGCLGVLSIGCGRANYGAGCKKAAELTAPWTELNLPLEDGKARVCESDSDELKLRSYSWSTPSAAAAAFESAVTAAGYAKDRCNGQACYYIKDGLRLSVHPMKFRVKKRKLVTVVLTQRQVRAGLRK